ncbi:MAG: Spy/CpxP family protein refolding chaperone [Gammaproteobacteria bacterium]
MKRKTLVFAGLLSALGIGTAGAAFQHAHKGGWGHGWGRGMAMGPGPMCGGQRGERVEDMISFVENFVKLDAAQTDAWNKLAAALRAGNVSFDQACAALDKDATTATARLDALEQMLSTGLGVVQNVRPAFDGFYATLSAQQKQLVDKLFNRRGPHHGPMPDDEAPDKPNG